MTTPTPASTPAPSPPVPLTPAASPTGDGSRAGRLPNGELRRMVAEVLTDRAGAELTPRAVADVLARSSGAVANALATLAARGLAEQTTATPARYRATPATAAATASPAAPAAPGSAGSSRAAGSPRKSAAITSGSSTAAPAGSSGAATPGAGRGEVVSGPVPRPNGQMYHPRTVSGLPDVTALRRLREAGVPALMYGPPGTGKTSVIEAAFTDLLTVPGDGDTTVADLVGEYTQSPDGRFVFVHGPLVRAMREGRTLFIDDATLIPPTVLAVVYPALDGRRQIVIKANSGEVVDAAPGFYVVAGHNPGVHGAVLTDALSSRFSVQIQVWTDYDLATTLKIDRRAVQVARNLARRASGGEIGWAPQLRELIAFDKIATVLGVDAAASNLVGTAPDEDRDTVATVVRGVFGRDVAPLALGARI